MRSTTNYLKQFVTFAAERLQQNISRETFKENMVSEARAILNQAAAQNIPIDLQRLERFLQFELKYQMVQYRKKEVSASKISR